MQFYFFIQMKVIYDYNREHNNKKGHISVIELITFPYPKNYRDNKHAHKEVDCPELSWNSHKP